MFPQLDDTKTVFDEHQELTFENEFLKMQLSHRAENDFAVEQLEKAKDVIQKFKEFLEATEAEITDLRAVEREYDFLSQDKRETFGVCASRLETILLKFKSALD